jgi:MFS family permease
MSSPGEQRTLAQGLQTLRECPRELWLVFFLKYLESYAYFVLSYTLILYLSDEFDFTDEEAGWAYGIYGMLITVYGFFMGTVIDNIGVKWSLVGGMTILFFSRLALTFTMDVRTILTILFTTLPLGGAMGIPVMQIAVKRYTKDINRTVSFSIFYVMMNLAAITAAPAIDLFHAYFPDGATLVIVGHSVEVSTYRLLIFTGACMTFLSWFIALCLIREQSEEELDERVRQAPRSVISEVTTSPAFWRFFLLVVLLLGVRIIYRHLDATFPKYMVREFGHSALYGSVIAINPLCVCMVVPMLAPISMRVPPLKMILLGATVSSLSPFFLAAGHTYTTAVFFVTCLSLGEAVWSPRLFEYTVMVADPGREGTYMALASAPTFLATLVTGAMSGWLLETFCPATGPRHSELMWFLVGCMSILSPILLYAFYDVIDDSGGPIGGPAASKQPLVPAKLLQTLAAKARSEKPEDWNERVPLKSDEWS